MSFFPRKMSSFFEGYFSLLKAKYKILREAFLCRSIFCFPRKMSLFVLLIKVTFWVALPKILLLFVWGSVRFMGWGSCCGRVGGLSWPIEKESGAYSAPLSLFSSFFAIAVAMAFSCIFCCLFLASAICFSVSLLMAIKLVAKAPFNSTFK